MLRAALIFLLLALPLSLAKEVGRVALLIGNEAYRSEIGELANPHNDVMLLEQVLKGLGFEVVTVRDAILGTLYQTVDGYARRLQAAGPNAVGLFYDSGHGASNGNTNYLIPVDVKTTEAGELWDQSLRLKEITHKLKSEAGNATHFVIFDACRNTLKLMQPGSRAVVQSKGFVPVAQENGMLIAYATAEGELASDVGKGAGPYASALAEEIVKPGIEAVVMFRAVQRRVRAAIRQKPYLGFSALGMDCPSCPVAGSGIDAHRRRVRRPRPSSIRFLRDHSLFATCQPTSRAASQKPSDSMEGRMSALLIRRGRSPKVLRRLFPSHYRGFLHCGGLGKASTLYSPWRRSAVRSWRSGSCVMTAFLSHSRARPPRSI